jgi:peptidoglycan/LPS O-acetylase OafA/YrhL
MGKKPEPPLPENPGSYCVAARTGRFEISPAVKRIFSNSDVLVTGGTRDRSLDGLRAIAALCVFATHATYLNLMPSFLNFRGAGRAGVVLFFFLSAFLISGPFFSDSRKALTWQAWTTYGLRRLFRIVPLYFLVLLALFCAHIEPFDGSSLSDNARLLGLHLTFEKGSSVFWTIIVEMRFYVVLPFLLIVSALVLEKFKHGRSVLLVTGGLWIAGVVTGVTDDGFLRNLGIDKHAPVFIAGVLTALLFHTSKIDAHSPANKALFEGLAWCSAVVFVCLSMPALYYAITQEGSISAYTETRSPVLEAFWDARIPWIGLVLGLFFFSYLNGIGLMSRLFAWSPLVWIGRVSFGVYLIHLTVLQVFVTFDLPATIKLSLALIFSVGVASLLFLMLEAPMISLGQNWSSRLRPRAANERVDYTRSA